MVPCVSKLVSLRVSFVHIYHQCIFFNSWTNNGPTFAWNQGLYSLKIYCLTGIDLAVCCSRKAIKLNHSLTLKGIRIAIMNHLKFIIGIPITIRQCLLSVLRPWWDVYIYHNMYSSCKSWNYTDKDACHLLKIHSWYWELYIDAILPKEPYP